MKAVLLMGPTATGKTELAIRLAESYPIEIISVDSALIYKDMNIGSAKPSTEELLAVPHHLIDIITPLEVYSVADFINDSVSLIKQINQKGKLPILVGGTMMYFNGLLNGISDLPEANPLIRKKLERFANMHSYQALYDQLLKIDPVSASKIRATDKQRLVRALEVYCLTKKPISQLQIENKLNLTHNINFIPFSIIPDNRQILHDRIERRFNNMIQSGLIEELQNLKIKYPELTDKHTSMRSVGYAQTWKYLENKINFEELLNMGKAATRQLAKRQITWLRGMKNLINISNSELNLDKMFDELLMRINGLG